MNPILVLTPPRFSDKQRALQRRFFKEAGLPLNRIHWRCFHTHSNETSGRSASTRWTPPTPENRQRILRGIALTKPALILINDKTALDTLVGKHSLALCRGSTYTLNSIPALVLNDVLQTVHGHTSRYASWVWQEDTRKACRILFGKLRPQRPFEYRVVRSSADLRECESACQDTAFLACDIETWGQGDNSHITCVGLSTAAGGQTFVLPLHTIEGDSLPILPSGQTRAALKRILENPRVPKVFQNGLYDCSYLLRERLVPANWWIDTAVLSHAIWQEAPKTLHFLASMALDSVQYWKDETRTAETAASKIEEPFSFPRFEEDLLQYWKYNALDAYYTSAITPFYLSHLNLLPWARENYIRTMRQIPIALLMGMSGIRINDNIRQFIIQNSLETASRELTILQTMTDEPEFNPGSPQQVKKLIYETLKTPPLPRKGTSTQESILRLLQPSSPLLSRIIDQIWKAKKPGNIISKYGASLSLQRKRLYFSLSPTGTVSFRYSSKKSNYHTGTQIQNINKDGPVRAMLEADPGYLLVECDYSQSDAYFTAFSAAEQRFISDLHAPEDTHCLNAARFFKRSYQEIYDGHVADEEWVSHSTKGIRQITKRIIYGANYRMAAFTLYIQMGYQGVVAAAQALGYKNATTWEINQLVKFCDSLLTTYFEEIYPGLNPWLDRAIQIAAMSGNKATCIGGLTRTFFGDLAGDQKIQREFAAFWGQSGTAANINHSLDRVFYEKDATGKTWLEKGGRLVFQVHDSILTQVPVDKLFLIPELINLMDNERVAPNGTKFHVPTETKVGFGWGKRMLKWPVSLEDIEEHDFNYRKKNSHQGGFPRGV